jgi:tetratricopeptide (TPR) repeat protein
MASIIPGYEYDIFISYRQKDNKYDGWVTEFVNNLKKELDATFKEEVSVFFDINPHDGLLETHDVHDSLKEKLKCLIFIPIISRTYCDPRSFAWEHEFKSFIETSSRDQFGLKIILPNGFVASRVLPVRIHELDNNDLKLCESLLGGGIRGIDFVFKSAGVNRPIRSNEDHPHDNLNKTYYRDQINKVANAIDEIINSLKSGKSLLSENNYADQKNEIKDEKISKVSIMSNIYDRIKMKGLLIFLSILLCLSSVFVIYKFFITTHPKKSIAVIPFTYPENDYKLAEYAIGAMDAIISKLQEIKSLNVRHRVYSIQYLDTKKTIEELRDELNSNYLIEISIRSIAANLKMGIVLREVKGNKQLWGDQYDIDKENLIPLFTEIAQIIARNLNVTFSSEELKNIETDLTKKPLAYRNYLTGNARLFTAMGNKFIDSISFVSAIKMYDKAIESDPDFAIAYSRRAIARSWGINTGQLNSTHIEKCWSDIKNALRINSELTDAQIALGFYYYYCEKDFLNALLSFKTASVKDPENYQPLFYMALVYRRMGDWEMSQRYINNVLLLNPQEPLFLTNIGMSFDYLHKYDSAIIYHQKAIYIDPGWSASYLNKIETHFLKSGNTTEAHALIDSLTRQTGGEQMEIRIRMDMYDGNYSDAFNKAEKTGPEDFKIKGSKYLYQAMISSLLNNPINTEKYYDAALAVLNIDLSNDSTNAEIHGLIGMAYAGRGNKDRAIAEGKKAIELTVLDKNKMAESDMILNLAKIYTLLGLYDDALSNIEYLLTNPSMLSVRLLQLDPVWKPLLTLQEYKILMANFSKNNQKQTGLNIPNLKN